MDDTTDIKEVPIDQVPMNEFKKARAANELTVKTSTITEDQTKENQDVDNQESSADQKEEQNKQRKRGGFQQRIDRLIKRQAMSDEEIAKRDRRIAELEAKTKVEPENKTSPTKTDGEPKREEFTSDEAYWRAIARWEVKQELNAEREAEEKRAAEESRKAAVEDYNKRAIEASSRYDDWKEVIDKSTLTIPEAVGEAIQFTLKNGPEVAYFLGTHPEICEEMLGVHPLEAVAMAVKISERLAATDDETEDDKEEEIEGKTETKAEEKPVRKAPPIRPVTGWKTRSTLPLDKVSFADYKKLRAQGRVQ